MKEKYITPKLVIACFKVEQGIGASGGPLESISNFEMFDNIGDPIRYDEASSYTEQDWSWN